ncbi:MAG TPA: 50S ribosomal protein L25 [Chthoniobacteraceae bacterium]|nr:50S ribosomal protein L25 [Chthoniobacteraceae bacterium]
MAKQVKLSAQLRPSSGRSAVKKIKAQGAVPAVIYGGKDKPQTLQVNSRDINTLLAHAVGENILVDLEISDSGKTTNRLALIQEIQHAPLGGAVLHVDFHSVKADEILHAHIPIEPHGESVGVRSYGGILDQSLRRLDVACLPKDLPEIIRVDVSALNIGDSIHVKDIKLPEGVTSSIDGDLTVFHVSAPVAEEVKPAEEAAATGPEVIKEKKPEGEAAAPAAGDKKAAEKKPADKK